MILKQDMTFVLPGVQPVGSFPDELSLLPIKIVDVFPGEEGRKRRRPFFTIGFVSVISSLVEMLTHAFDYIQSIKSYHHPPFTERN